MNIRFLFFIQIVMALHAMASLAVMFVLLYEGHWAGWLLLPWPAVTSFIMFRWGDLFRVDNPVTRAAQRGEFDYFIEAARNVRQRAEQLLKEVEEKNAKRNPPKP